jgi:hypothetical protein
MARALLKPVCKECQSRLNETFEAPAAPILKAMIDGSIVQLSPRQQEIVAGWIAKTLLVLGLCPGKHPSGGGHAAQLRLHLRDMLNSGAPPDNTTIRIAYVSKNLDPPQRGFVPPGWPNLDRMEILSISGFPHLLCEMVVSDAPNVLAFIDATKDDDRFLRIWPRHATDVLWPPPSLLGLLDIAVFIAEWGEPAAVVRSDFPTLKLQKPNKA